VIDAKQRAAEAALALIHNDMVVGLGTGSTADHFLVALSRALRDGRLRGVRGIPTSRRSERNADELGIPLMTLAQCPHPDITVDGADEITPNLDLIKGLGGALLREKIVAQNSKRLVIVADESKMVETLGTRGALPVEVVPFGHETHEPFFRSLGCVPTLRRGSDGAPVTTDNGNLIYDCRFARIDAPRTVELALESRAGVVETGLFLGIAGMALVAAGEAEVRRLTRSGG
jgi:ribose 5-phosphate isomerase A